MLCVFIRIASLSTIYHFKDIKENHPKLSLICSYGNLFLGSHKRVRNSHGKRAISVRAIEVLLYRVALTDTALQGSNTVIFIFLNADQLFEG